MQIDFYSLMAIIFIALIICAIYDIKKKSDVKLEQIKLERERVVLEQKRVENENKIN